VASVQRRFASDGLQIVGVHTPEFARERDRDRLGKKIGDLGIVYPVVLDSDYTMWDALDNHYWPALYLIDRHGRIRHLRVGEVHVDSREAEAFESVIKRLLREPAPPPQDG
jgi:hypothetical protein